MSTEKIKCQLGSIDQRLLSREGGAHPWLSSLSKCWLHPLLAAKVLSKPPRESQKLRNYTALTKFSKVSLAIKLGMKIWLEFVSSTLSHRKGKIWRVWPRPSGRGFDFIKLNRFALKHNMYWWSFSFSFDRCKNKRTANWNTDYLLPASKLSSSWPLKEQKQNKTCVCLVWLGFPRSKCACTRVVRVKSFVRACSVQLGWVRVCSGLRSRFAY